MFTLRNHIYTFSYNSFSVIIHGLLSLFQTNHLCHRRRRFIRTFWLYGILLTICSHLLCIHWHCAFFSYTILTHWSSQIIPTNSIHVYPIIKSQTISLLIYSIHFFHTGIFHIYFQNLFIPTSFLIYGHISIQTRISFLNQYNFFHTVWLYHRHRLFVQTHKTFSWSLHFIPITCFLHILRILSHTSLYHINNYRSIQTYILFIIPSTFFHTLSFIHFDNIDLDQICISYIYSYL